MLNLKVIFSYKNCLAQGAISAHLLNKSTVNNKRFDQLENSKDTI